MDWVRHRETDGCTEKGMDGWMSKDTNRWMLYYTDRYRKGQMEGSKDDSWMNGWTDGRWRERRMIDVQKMMQRRRDSMIDEQTKGQIIQ